MCPLFLLFFTRAFIHSQLFICLLAHPYQCHLPFPWQTNPTLWSQLSNWRWLGLVAGCRMIWWIMTIIQHTNTLLLLHHICRGLKYKQSTSPLTFVASFVPDWLTFLFHPFISFTCFSFLVHLQMFMNFFGSCVWK